MEYRKRSIHSNSCWSFRYTTFRSRFWIWLIRGFKAESHLLVLLLDFFRLFIEILEIVWFKQWVIESSKWGNIYILYFVGFLNLLNFLSEWSCLSIKCVVCVKFIKQRYYLVSGSSELMIYFWESILVKLKVL